MQIRTKLTLLFTIVIAALLAIFAFSVYYSAEDTREEEYYKRLQQQAVTKANLLFVSKIEPSVLQLIYQKSPNTLYQEEVAVYDSTFHLLYHDAVTIDKVKETGSMIDSILQTGSIRFYQGQLQVVGFVYQHDGRQFAVTAAAEDEYGYTKLERLKKTLLFFYAVAIIFIFFFGRFLATQSLKPVSALIEKVKRITATNLDLRVDEGNRKDEIAALAITFNEMLQRLEASFDAQKAFVSNISHELRTPLTAMQTELQLASTRQRTQQEYQAVIFHIMQDTQKLVRLSNSLLDFAKASYDQTEVAFREIRVDEILLDAQNEVIHHQPTNKVTIAFSEDDLQAPAASVSGNAYLLKVAFINLMENACKFSFDHTCRVIIGFEGNTVKVQFTDNGVGISAEDMSHIFTPFYRGKNKQKHDGNGIGLSLTKKIIMLHKGDISVQSMPGEQTTFTVLLPAHL